MPGAGLAVDDKEEGNKVQTHRYRYQRVSIVHSLIYHDTRKLMCVWRINGWGDMDGKSWRHGVSAPWHGGQRR